MAVDNRVNLLEVAKTLDPRFVQGMPQEVADAFARGDIQRLIRTSDDLPTKQNAIGRPVSKTGDYTGSIYAQHRDGRIARFKNPELAAEGGDMRHAGWKARTAGVEGRSAFFDQAHVIREDSFSQVGSPERNAFDQAKAMNPTLSNDQIIFALTRQGHPIATPTTAAASDIMGKQIFETMKIGSTDADPNTTHRGHVVSDVFESTGERYYFAGDTGRGSLETEPIENYISRKGSVSPAESTQAAPVEKSKSVSETTKNGRPVIKVGEVVESKGEKVKKQKEKESIKPKTDIQRIQDSAIDAVISDAKPTDDDEIGSQDMDDKIQEKLKEKLEEKIDPLGKAENFVENKAEKAKESLIDSLFEADNQRFEASRSTAAVNNIQSSTSSDVIRGAAGRAPTTTPAARAALNASGSANTYAKMPAEQALKTMLDDGLEVAKSVLGGFKNSKNIRLAATAALLSSAGYGIGKLRGGSFKRDSQEMSIDEEAELRKRLMSDG